MGPISLSTHGRLNMHLSTALAGTSLVALERYRGSYFVFDSSSSAALSCPSVYLSSSFM